MSCSLSSWASPETSFPLGRDELQLELLGLLGEPLDLLLAIPGLVVFHAFVHILFAVLEHPVDQSRELVRHRRDRLRRSEPGSQSPEVRSQGALAIAQRGGGQAKRG